MKKPFTLRTILDYRSIASKFWKTTYHLSLRGFFQNFTTKPTGYPANYFTPHYEIPVVTGVNSRLLNPFGYNTANEYLVYGTGVYRFHDTSGHQIYRFRDDVRSYGIKNPMTFVGWGYDTFGYPVPNASAGWDVSGIFGTGIPATGFGYTINATGEGTWTNFDNWKAGPLDLRWDNHRKVWTAGAGVYPAIVDGVTILGGGAATDPQFPENIRYSVRVYDGAFTGIRVTGIQSSMPRSTGLYKIYPFATGTPAILYNAFRASGNLQLPYLALMQRENEYVVDCNATATAGGSLSLLYNNLTTDPLAVQYGGLGLDIISSGQILIGGTGNNYESRLLVAGTGISIDLSDPTRLVIHAISGSTGVALPLAISQGGTAATGKVWVDFTTNQTVGGIKNFTSGIYIPNGTTAFPAFSFASATNYGLAYTTGTLNIISSGSPILSMNPTGSYFRSPLLIYPTIAYNQVFRVKHPDVFGTTGVLLTEWVNLTNTTLASIDSSGGYRGPYLEIAQSGNSITGYRINPYPTNTGWITLTLPRQNGELALREQALIVTDTAQSGHILQYDNSNSSYRSRFKINNPIVSITGNYAVTADDYFVFVRAATGITITLPDATTVRGQEFVVKDASGNFSSIQPFAVTSPTGQKIDNASSLLMSINYVGYRFVSDGSDYYLV